MQTTSLRILASVALLVAGCGSSPPPVQSDPAPVYAIEEGSRVLVVWDETARLWPATVVSVHSTVAFVRFDDGSEAYIAIGNIAGPAPEPSGATTPPDDAGDGDGDGDADGGDVPPSAGPFVLYDLRDRLVPARAVRCDDGIVVVYANGRTGEVPFADVVTDPIARGDAVLALYQGGSTEYPATVEGMDGDLVRVLYSDGSEESLGLGHIASVLRPASARSTTGRVPPLCRELRGATVPWVLVRDSRVASFGARDVCAEGTPVYRPRLAAGMAVYASWGGTEYPATIASVGDGTVGIEWYDGSTAELPTADLRRVIVPEGALEEIPCD